MLHAEDGSHPTVAGPFLAASIFYASLFDGDHTKVETDVGNLGDEEFSKSLHIGSAQADPDL